MTATSIITTASALGVSLTARPGGMLAATPASAITPELATELRTHKRAVWLAIVEADTWARTTRPDGGTSWLRRGSEHLTADLEVSRPESAADAVCRCGSDEYRDVEIHGGESTRRDCAQCGRFLEFVRWHEAPATEVNE